MQCEGSSSGIVRYCDTKPKPCKNGYLLYYTIPLAYGWQPPSPTITVKRTSYRIVTSAIRFAHYTCIRHLTLDSYNSSAFHIGLFSAGSLLAGTTRAQGQLLPRNTRVTAEEQAHAGSYAAVMPTAGSIQAHTLGALVHLVWCSGQRYDGLNGM